MSSIELYIARHGETDYNKKGVLQGRGIDAPLNDTGKEQARLLSGCLPSNSCEAIFCSSLIRTWQTAEPYQHKIQLEPVKDRNLDEMHFGDYEGVKYEQAANDLSDLQKAWESGETSVKIPGGESPEEVFTRADEAVKSRLNEFEGKVMVLFLHGRLIRILLSEWLGYGLPNMHKIEHQNGALNKLVYQNNEFNAVYLNKTDHLLIQ